MTEVEWLTCTDRLPMLAFLRGKASDRKLRLFALACCARVSHLLQEEEGQEAITYVERYAEGAIKPNTLRKRLRRLESARQRRIKPYSPQWFANLVVEQVVSPSAVLTPDQGSQFVTFALPASADHPHGGEAWMVASREENASLCKVLRDLFGNPFRPVAVERAWLTAAGQELAQAAYEQRLLPSDELDPERLAVLADALEEAGCTDPAILSHLRGPGPHVRGCWCVDLLLSKE
jgi:hypothetical protein